MILKNSNIYNRATGTAIARPAMHRAMTQALVTAWLVASGICEEKIHSAIDRNLDLPSISFRQFLIHLKKTLGTVRGNIGKHNIHGQVFKDVKVDWIPLGDAFSDVVLANADASNLAAEAEGSDFLFLRLPVKAVETNSEICLNSPFGKLFGGCTQRWQETGEVLMVEPTALRLRRLSPWAQVQNLTCLV